MAYIATKPVRFDRDYAIGEIIPDEVIDPSMTIQLSQMGKILKTDITTTPKAASAKTATKANKTAEKAAEKTIEKAAEKEPNKAETKETEPVKANDAKKEKE